MFRSFISAGTIRTLLYINVASLGAKESTIRTGDRERLGAKVYFHLADRRLLAFNYVYGSVYESDEGSGRASWNGFEVFPRGLVEPAP